MCFVDFNRLLRSSWIKNASFGGEGHRVHPGETGDGIVSIVFGDACASLFSHSGGTGDFYSLQEHFFQYYEILSSLGGEKNVAIHGI